MTSLPVPTSYKVRKGDTLSAIARDHGFREWKPIWNAPDNRALVAKRKAPEKIEPGDSIVIPLTEKQEKIVSTQLTKLQSESDADLSLSEALEAEVARGEARVACFNRLIAARHAMGAQLTSELNDNLNGLKNVGETVDAIATLTQLGISVGKIADIYAAAAEAEGSELEALNKEAVKETSDLIVDDAQDKTIKAVGILHDSVNMALAAVGILATSFEKMTSPSFWANVWVQMVDNHKGWSEAVSSDIGDDIKKRIRTVAADESRDIALLTKRKSEQQAHVDELRRQLKAAQSRNKATEAEIKLMKSDYPRLP